MRVKVKDEQAESLKRLRRLYDNEKKRREFADNWRKQLQDELHNRRFDRLAYMIIGMVWVVVAFVIGLWV